MLTKPALEALTDQTLAAVAEYRKALDADTLADAESMAALLAEEFRGDEITAGRAVMSIARKLGTLLAGYEQFPGGLQLVPAVIALAAEQVTREAGERQ